MLRCPALSISLGALALLATTVPTRARQDPFRPAWRWSRAPEPGAAWTPGAIALGAGGGLAWCALEGPAGGLVCLALDGDDAHRERGVDARYAQAVGALQVAAARGAGPVLALAQYPAPDLLRRRTEVACYDAVGSARAELVPRWTHASGTVGNGAARVACDDAGALLVVAVHDPDRGEVRLEWLAPQSGAVLRSAAVAAPGLERLAVAGDGSLVALAAGPFLHAFDREGTPLFTAPLPGGAAALAVARDGESLVAAAGGALVRWTRSTLGAWSEARVEGPGSAACAALSDDGRSVGVGWWDPADPGAATFALLDGPTLRTLVSARQQGLPGDLQNLPRVAFASSDGDRVAFGTWGNGRDPEVLLLDRVQARVVQALDVAGSVRALALDPGGTRLVVGHKDGHANHFGTSGAVRSFDTGERPLQALAPLEAGGEVALVAAHPDAEAVFFLLGDPAEHFRGLPGAVGDVRVRAPMRVHARRADALGRAEWSGALSGDPALVGRVLAAQAGFRVRGRTLLAPEGLELLVLPRQ